MGDQKRETLNTTDLGGEACEGFDRGSFFKRLDRYGRAHEDTMQFADYAESVNYGLLADSLRKCGVWIEARDYFTVGQIRVKYMCTCKKHLVCRLCAIRRGAKGVRVYKAKVDALLALNPELRPYMVTLTVKNGPDLLERFKHLASSLRAYHKRRHGARQTGEVLKAWSAVWSYEFTNKGNGWHPHVHAIWLCEEAPDPFKLSEEWHSLTGDSFIVDVRPVSQDDPVSGFLEVFKYAVKFSELEHSDRLWAFTHLRGERLLGSFGDLRGLNIEPEDSDDLLEDLPFIDRIFQYRRGQGYQERTVYEAAS